LTNPKHFLRICQSAGSGQGHFRSAPESSLGIDKSQALPAELPIRRERSEGISDQLPKARLGLTNPKHFCGFANPPGAVRGHFRSAPESSLGIDKSQEALPADLPIRRERSEGIENTTN